MAHSLKYKILLVIAAMALSLCVRVTLRAATPEATFQSVRGTVEIKTADGDDWQRCAAGDPVSVDDLVRIGPASEAVIHWRVGHNIKLYAATLFTISKLDIDDRDEKTEVTAFSGKALVKANKLISSRSNFSVRTPTAVAGVRGTEFVVEIGDDASTVISLLEGRLDIVSDQINTILESNQRLDIRRNGPPPQPTRIPQNQRELFRKEADSIETSSGDGADEKEKVGDKDKRAVNETVNNALDDAKRGRFLRRRKGDFPPFPPKIDINVDVPPLPPPAPPNPTDVPSQPPK